MDGRENHLVEERKENLRHLGNRLVAQATEDQRLADGFSLEQSRQPGAQSPGAGRIVRHVQNPLHAVSAFRCAPAAPGQRVCANPFAMDAGVMGKPCADASSTAAAMASATLRCW